MGRQLFLHHYLPAHLASALVAGALLEFIFTIEPASPVSSSSSVSDAFSPSSSTALTTDAGAVKKAGKGGIMARRKPVRERLIGQGGMMTAWAAAVAVLSVLIWCFIYFAPLTYGKPGLNVDEVLRRKWLGYDLHFAK